MIALDSNILIYVFEGHEQFGPDALRLLKSIEKTSLDGTISELVYGEMCSHPNMTNKQVTKATGFVDKLGITAVPVSRRVLLAASGISRAQRIKLPDAIHLATAIEAGAEVFITNDHKLAKQNIKDLRIELLTDFCTSL